jgi:hypothetical protein
MFTMEYRSSVVSPIPPSHQNHDDGVAPRRTYSFDKEIILSAKFGSQKTKGKQGKRQLKQAPFRGLKPASSMPQAPTCCIPSIFTDVSGSGRQLPMANSQCTLPAIPIRKPSDRSILVSPVLQRFRKSSSIPLSPGPQIPLRKPSKNTIYLNSSQSIVLQQGQQKQQLTRLTDNPEDRFRAVLVDTSNHSEGSSEDELPTMPIRYPSKTISDVVGELCSGMSKYKDCTSLAKQDSFVSTLTEDGSVCDYLGEDDDFSNEGFDEDGNPHHLSGDFSVASNTTISTAELLFPSTSSPYPRRWESHECKQLASPGMSGWYQHVFVPLSFYDNGARVFDNCVDDENGNTEESTTCNNSNLKKQMFALMTSIDKSDENDGDVSGACHRVCQLTMPEEVQLDKCIHEPPKCPKRIPSKNL